MSTRPSVNKRQREVLRKERQAEKVLRRDQRRSKRNLPAEETPEGTEPLVDVPAEEGRADAAGSDGGRADTAESDGG